jgi:hypothetical protein
MNRSNQNIRDVGCLIIFYDRSGEALEVDAVKFAGIIPAGLARRVTGKVDGSVQDLFARAEFRCLKFKIDR